VIDDGNTRDEFAPEDDMSIDEMPDVQDDETLRDVVAALGTLPPVNEADVQRIVARAAAEAEVSGRRAGPRWAVARSDRESRERGVLPLHRARPRWFTTIPMAAAATLVFAAGVGGFVIRDLTSTDARPLPVGASGSFTSGGTAPAAVSAVAADASAEAPIATQFVLDAPAASGVALVGAFNGWDATATPLVRDPATGLWSVTLPLAPGRHVYAFMVDDTTFTLDPRAPDAHDPELGTSGSVILVGTP
jgi:hypothetical protein